MGLLSGSRLTRGFRRVVCSFYFCFSFPLQLLWISSPVLNYGATVFNPVGLIGFVIGVFSFVFLLT